MFIPVNEPLLSKEAKKNIGQALKTGWLSSSGSFVKQLEQEFAEYLGVKHGIAVCNGTAALHIALLTLDLGKGDEVIVPAFTMASSWLAVIYTGAKPVFVDCEMETYNIDIGQIEKKITKKTKAIMPVHIYGHACEMDAINNLAKKYNLYVIEDAAEAHGGEYKGQKCGALGHIGCFSFYANKIITTGEGGMIATDNENMANRARKFRDLCHSDTKRFIHDNIGYNYRMTNLQAAIGCGELKNIEKYLKIKQWMATLYNEKLKDLPGVKLPSNKNYVKNVYWMYGILIDKNKFAIGKDRLRTKLKEKSVDTRDFFYPPHDQPVLKKIIGKTKFPNAQYLAENGLYLPSGLAITEKQIDSVCKKIKSLAG